MTDSAFIHDGYTKRGYIKANPGFHPAIRFVWRPALIQARSEWFAKLAQQTDAKAKDATVARFIASRLVSWDLTDEKGNAVVLDGKTPGQRAEIVLRMEPNLFDRLFAIVASQQPSDIDPDLAERVTHPETISILEALESDKPYPIYVGEEEDKTEKN